MGAYTHVVEYSGGRSVVEISCHAEIEKFARPMRTFDGEERFALTVWALPPGMDYAQAVKAGVDAVEFIQAGGSADAMMVDLRKAGGSQWGVDWVRYVVGRAHAAGESLDVVIKLPHGPEMVSRSQVFTADEAVELIFSYYKTGDVPAGYILRPVQGFSRDGRNITLGAVHQLAPGSARGE